MLKRRNPYACLPIMRKGGVHQRTKSGMRASLNRQLEDEIEDYLSEKQEEQAVNRLTARFGEPDILRGFFYLVFSYLLKICQALMFNNHVRSNTRNY